MFIAVDGIDGAGKTTLVRQLAATLHPVPMVTKEPTDTSKWGRILREASMKGRLSRDEEIEYFHLDRLAHIADRIKPALDRRIPVITDRYVDSTLAFQAMDPADADVMYEKFRSEILIPDITFILDCPVEIGLARIAKRNLGTSVYETEAFLLRAREIYRTRRGPNYCHIDAAGTPEQTFAVAFERLETVAKAHGGITLDYDHAGTITGASTASPHA